MKLRLVTRCSRERLLGECQGSAFRPSVAARSLLSEAQAPDAEDVVEARFFHIMKRCQVQDQTMNLIEL